MTEPAPTPIEAAQRRHENGAQTDVEVLTRIGIPLRFGEREFRVRPRTMKQDRAWMDQVLAKVIARLTVFDGEKLRINDIIGALGDANPDMLGLILAYDETEQLPPAEWIEDHAFTTQVLDAFTTLLEVAYPPFRMSRRLLPADRASAIIGSLLEWAFRQTLSPSSEPSNSPSPSGATEPPKKSKRPSPAASFGS